MKNLRKSAAALVIVSAIIGVSLQWPVWSRSHENIELQTTSETVQSVFEYQQTGETTGTLYLNWPVYFSTARIPLYVSEIQ